MRISDWSSDVCSSDLAEQGLGDAIQFARYAPLLARAGATVILACPDPLAALFTTLKGDPEIVAERAPPPSHDCHALLLSLPHLMNTTLAAVPAETPYLAVPEGTACPDRKSTRPNSSH